MNKNKEFWQMLDRLVEKSEIIVDRPKGSYHPKYPEFYYHVDYGYLSGTTSSDGDGIDVWIGSDNESKLDTIICTVDIIKKDSEIKILLNCTEKEKELIYHTHNNSDFMKEIMIKREY